MSYFSATIVLLKENILPHSFLQYIFINKKTYQSDSLEQQILTHELTHVKQKHSLDVLFIELLQILFWFNPIFRYYRKAIQLNHEFLADDAVIQSHKNITEYQHVLLNTTAQHNNIYLASNLNYSLTKKRLLMMTTPSSKTKILLKKLVVIPLLAGFTLLFAQKVEAQKKKPQVVEIQVVNKGISKKGMKEYKRLFATAKKSIKVYKHRDVRKMIALYIAMSKKQQKTVVDIRTIVPPPPPHETEELVEIVEVQEVKELQEVEVLVEELEEVEDIIVRPVLIEVIEVGKKLKEYMRKHGMKSIPPPPPPLRKNASKKEIQRFNKAYKKWRVK
ncbi:MAG: M56 family metallopeptidase, partial [Flavobacteriaceae bacterium]|nr:M56 family metallopeptidase [Flavobacteriaceae bacterium]